MPDECASELNFLQDRISERMRFLVSLMVKNPMIVKGLEPFAQGIIVDFGVQIQAILSVLSGE